MIAAFVAFGALVGSVVIAVLAYRAISLLAAVSRKTLLDALRV